MSEPRLVEQIQTHYAEQLPLGERWGDPSYIYSWRNPIGAYQRERVRRALVTLLNQAQIDLANIRLLDIGCGTGDWLRFFAELRGEAGHLFGFDLSPHSLERGKLINASLPLMLADARRIPFASGTFNLISQFVTFEHLMEQADLFAAGDEVTRVCAAGGWLLWYDILPVESSYQRGFTLGDVQQLFPAFRVVKSVNVFRRIHLPGRTISTAYELARRSHLLADLAERVIPGPANNLMVLLQKNA